jgi:cytochrome c-type biogenesis protein CcmH/NrfG
MPAHKPMFGASSPGSLSLGAALDQNQTLGRLLQRLQESRERFAAIRELLPEHLREQVRPGPLDAAGWSLLAPSGAAASKLRQLVPALEARLHAQGWQPIPIRIKVQAA